MTDAKPLSDDELRLRMAQTMEQIFLHAQAGERVLLAVQARVEGAMAVAGIVDENQAQIDTDRHIAAQKKIISDVTPVFHSAAARDRPVLSRMSAGKATSGFKLARYCSSSAANAAGVA